MEENSIKRDSIDWNEFRRKVLDKVPNDATEENVNEAIQEALFLLGDNHSFFQKRSGQRIFARTISCPKENIGITTLPNNIGYVRVNPFSNLILGDEAQSYARNLQNAIANQDSGNLEGWIVDLRNNGGGNMWPMIVGIGPLLGDGISGYFIDAEQNSVSWGYYQGSAKIDDQVIMKLDNPYQLINNQPKIAFLINSSIASSGEAVAISFNGKENTKSFGDKTCGVATSNRRFLISDGASLFLTHAYFADKNKNIHLIGLLPDKGTTLGDEMQLALDWLSE